MLINCWKFNMDHNDAFGAMRLGLYRHFLRLSIKDDQLTIYSVGIDKTPSRDQWLDNPEVNDKRASRIIPKDPLCPKLIDDPIVINANDVMSVLQVSKRRAATAASAVPSATQPT